MKGLVDFQIYTDDLAKEMGVLPPLRKLFFQKPKLWMAIMFGPVRAAEELSRGWLYFFIFDSLYSCMIRPHESMT